MKNQGLRKIQELDARDHPELDEYIDTIKNCFPPDVVDFYAPNYADALARKVGL